LSLGIAIGGGGFGLQKASLAARFVEIRTFEQGAPSGRLNRASVG